MFGSLKRFLNRREDQFAPALLRMLHLLLESIGAHAVHGDAAEYQKFRNDVAGARQKLDQPLTSQEVLVLAGHTVQLLEEYNARTSRFVQRQCAELQSMVGMLTKTMGTLAAGGETSMKRLQAIERQLQKASLIEDFQTAKARMSECLENLHTEISRQREESERHVSQLRSAVERAKNRARRPAGEARSGPRRPAPVEGRAQAEAYLQAAITGNRQIFAAVFVVERADLVAARFGQPVADDVLEFFQEHLSQTLHPDDRLFRWTGASFLAVIERPESVGKVREEMNRAASQRLSRTVTVGDRSVLLPVSATWTVVSAADTRPVKTLIRHVDSFAAGAAAEKTAAAAG